MRRGPALRSGPEAGAERPRREPALLAWALAAALMASIGIAPAASPRIRPSAPVSAPSDQPIDIRLDLEVAEQFLGFMQRGGASAEELERWVRLPGNRELLRVGRMDGGLSPEILKEAARVEAAGAEFPGPPILGRLSGGDRETLRRVLEGIRERRGELVAETARFLAPYVPQSPIRPPVTVYFHLGGSWDGRTTDAVYINLAVLETRGTDSLAGLDALLVHEVFHAVQGVLLPGVEDWSSRQGALYTALLRVQQEGIARHLEFRFLKERSSVDTLDQTNLAKYEEGLRRAGENAERLAKIADGIAAGRLEEARVQTLEGLRSGGALYAVGHSMAAVLEGCRGPSGIAATVTGGPIAFARAYLGCLGPDAPSLLPPGFAARLDELANGYGRDPVRSARRRREGLALLEKGSVEEARGVLLEAVDLDPTDATSAYNLACAYALDGRRRKALRWLETAVARGFTNLKHAAQDEDLRSLQEDERFLAILKAGGVEARRPAVQRLPEEIIP